MDSLLWIELGAYVLGVIGAVLLFLEFFQLPDYVRFNEKTGKYRLSITTEETAEYSPLGRIGAMLLAVAFAVLFVVRLFGA